MPKPNEQYRNTVEVIGMISGPVIALKNMKCGAVLHVVGFLEDDDCFLDLRGGDPRAYNLPMGTCFDVGDEVILPNRRSLVEYIEPILPINLDDFPELKECIDKSHCIAINMRCWGFRYLLSKQYRNTISFCKE